jgi:hypothetical protein
MSFSLTNRDRKSKFNVLRTLRMRDKPMSLFIMGN